jgi:hypothetical protein
MSISVADLPRVVQDYNFEDHSNLLVRSNDFGALEDLYRRCLDVFKEEHLIWVPDYCIKHISGYVLNPSKISHLEQRLTNKRSLICFARNPDFWEKFCSYDKPTEWNGVYMYVPISEKINRHEYALCLSQMLTSTYVFSLDIKFSRLFSTLISYLDVSLVDGASESYTTSRLSPLSDETPTSS